MEYPNWFKSIQGFTFKDSKTNNTFIYVGKGVVGYWNSDPDKFIQEEIENIAVMVLESGFTQLVDLNIYYSNYPDFWDNCEAL